MKGRLVVIIALLFSFAFVCSCKQVARPNKNVSDEKAVQNEHLKKLAFFVGKWKDKDENAQVTSTFKWDKNKNFLLHYFKSQTPGHTEFEGYQIIGWDPVKKKIRSWVFDSDGGFGESYWEKQGSNWYVTMLFTCVDGKKASATHIYTKIDDNTYTFASTDRDVEGEMLPNIGPFTVIREK